MTLLREIQILLERTYGRTGVNFEHFLISPKRHESLALLAGAGNAQLSDLGRLSMRVEDGKLRLGIYYNPRVIESLESNNPQHGLNDENIFPLMVLVEELDHAIHAAIKFRAGNSAIHSEEFVRDLELQAKVDTYLVLQKFCAFFNPGESVTAPDRRWLKACVFDSQNFTYEEPILAERYRETNRLGRRYVRHLDSLTPKRRTTEIRRFSKLSYQQKQRRIVALSS